MNPAELSVRLHHAAEFLAGELATVNVMAKIFQSIPTESLQDDFLLQSVLAVGVGPMTVHMVVGEPGTCTRGGVRYQTFKPLTPREAASVAGAVAIMLRRGGFDDVSVAVLDEYYEGVALRFTSDTDVRVVKFYASPVGPQ